MSYIRFQNIKRDDTGAIVSGSATIVETKYVPGKERGKNHSKREAVEKLGKVLWISDDKLSGIFKSPTRGVIEYDSATGSFKEVNRGDPRIQGFDTPASEPEIHTVFGDTYLFLTFLYNIGFADILSKAFVSEEERSRVLCHLSHTVLRDGGHIHCDDFIAKSFLVHIFDASHLCSLETDSPYFHMMGDDRVKMSFFKEYVKVMRKKYPSFGKSTYVDCAPLPNFIKALATNALCSHGVESTSVQTRLVIILDKETGLPVWFQIIAGNVLDLSTIKNVLGDVLDSLGIIIEDLILDAGYVSKSLLEALRDGTYKSLIARMPAKKGYPYKKLYNQLKSHLREGRHTFVREGHTYFGYKKAVTIFDCQINAYVYVDWVNAQSRMVEYIEKHPEEYEKMTPSQLDWLSVQFGYFVLISEKEVSPAELLDEYFLRTDIEIYNKTDKEYIKLLPLSKWDYTKVCGKILSDTIASICLIEMRKAVKKNNTGSCKVRSITSIIGKTQSLMCRKNAKNNTIIVETPNKQTKEAYSALKIAVPGSIKINEFKKKILGL